jgi:hypothetical protein
MSEITEAYRRIGDPEDRFDIEFWQSQGPEAIFGAALEMALDAEILKNGYADRPRFLRTVESYGKLPEW